MPSRFSEGIDKSAPKNSSFARCNRAHYARAAPPSMHEVADSCDEPHSQVHGEWDRSENKGSGLDNCDPFGVPRK